MARGSTRQILICATKRWTVEEADVVRIVTSKTSNFELLAEIGYQLVN